MVLTPRSPGVQNVLCKHDENSGAVEAGAIVYLSGSNKVAPVAASGNVPYGMLAQKVVAQLAGLPANFEFPGEIGASQARLGDPVCLYQSGIFETTHYILPVGCSAGDALYAHFSSGGKLTKVAASGAIGTDGARKVVAIAQNTLTTNEAAAGKNLTVKLLFV